MEVILLEAEEILKELVSFNTEKDIKEKIEADISSCINFMLDLDETSIIEYDLFCNIYRLEKNLSDTYKRIERIGEDYVYASSYEELYTMLKCDLFYNCETEKEKEELLRDEWEIIGDFAILR